MPSQPDASANGDSGDSGDSDDGDDGQSGDEEESAINASPMARPARSDVEEQVESVGAVEEREVVVEEGKSLRE